MDRDPDYLAHIAELPCLICGRPAVPHHQPERHKACMGKKASDYRAVPLCHDHHVGGGTKIQPGSFHRMSWPFWDKYKIDIESVIASQVTRYFFADGV